MFRNSNTFVNLSSSLPKNSSKGVQKAFEMYYFVCFTLLKTFCGIYSVILAQMPFFIINRARYMLICFRIMVVALIKWAKMLLANL